MHTLTHLQQLLKTSPYDAWALYDNKQSNPLAWQVLEVPNQTHCTRRWMVVIPKHGLPTMIVHAMEQAPLEYLHLPKVLYRTHEQFVQAVHSTLAPYPVVAMEYSEQGMLPGVSKVDAGTMEIVRASGVQVVSSQDLIQRCTSVLSAEQIAGVAITAGILKNIVLDAFQLVANALRNNEHITEYDVQSFIVSQFESHNMVTDHPPIVAIGSNASQPHYAPSALQHSVIPTDVPLLIDAWCKHRSPGAVYADITWVGFTGNDVPQEVATRFETIVRARNAAVQAVVDAFGKGLDIRGCDVDAACRNVIEQQGFGEEFIHRTGHSITTDVHGSGANIDGYETIDTRLLLPGTSFSIEPGVYQEGVLGLRTEIDVVIDTDGAVIVPTAPMQESLLMLQSSTWREQL
jgi:Xaa-Pro dipeptidase